MEQLNDHENYTDWEAPDTITGSQTKNEPPGAEVVKNPYSEDYVPTSEEQKKQQTYKRMTELAGLLGNWKNEPNKSMAETNVAALVHNILERLRDLDDEGVLNLLSQINNAIYQGVFTDMTSIGWLSESVAQYSGQLEERIQKMDGDHTLTFLNVLSGICNYRSPIDLRKMRVAGRDKLGKAFGDIFEQIYQSSPQDYISAQPKNVPYLETFIDAYPERAADFVEVLNKALVDEVGVSTVRKINTYLLTILGLSHNEEVDEIIGNYFQSIGLNWQRLRKAWGTTRGKDMHTIQSNLNTIMELESVNPGSCGELNREQGICFFERYTLETLDRQAKIKNKNVPYGVLMWPMSDYNGAFEEHRAVILALEKDLHKMGLSLRIVEAGGKFSAARRLLRLDQKYGAKQKISFLLLGGHGSSDSVQMGETRNREELESEPWYQELTPEQQEEYLNEPYLLSKDLDQGWVDRVKTFFKGKIPVVFASCKTGKKGGIAEKAASRVNAKSTAPTKSTNVKTIKPFKRGGIFNRRLGFSVEYREEGIAAEYGDE